MVRPSAGRVDYLRCVAGAEAGHVRGIARCAAMVVYRGDWGIDLQAAWKTGRRLYGDGELLRIYRYLRLHGYRAQIRLHLLQTDDRRETGAIRCVRRV